MSLINNICVRRVYSELSSLRKFISTPTLYSISENTRGQYLAMNCVLAASLLVSLNAKNELLSVLHAA